MKMLEMLEKANLTDKQKEMLKKQVRTFDH
jgi:hypothetical protein